MSIFSGGRWNLGGPFQFTGGGSAPVQPGTSATVFPTAATVQYHPNQQAGSVTKGGDTRILTCPDLKGLAGASATAGNGPIEMTDLLGRKFWRFTGAQWLTISTALAALSSQAHAIVAVGRVHHAATGSIVSLGINGSTAASTGRALMNYLNSGGTAPFLSCGNRAASGFSNSKYLIPGSQMQVLGTFSRGSGTGFVRQYINNQFIDTGTTVTNGTADGAEIGRYSFAGGSYGEFDLYELAIYSGIVDNTAAAAIMAAAVTNWNIPAVLNRFIASGDSITAGSFLPTFADCMTMVLTNPGQALSLPANWCVVNDGVSGNTIAQITTRRDVANGICDTSLLLPGRNLISVQAGRNDFVNTSASGDTAYAAFVALLNTTTTGYLQRGFEVNANINIASGGVQLAVDQMRVRLRAAAFLTDTLSDTGNTYDGKVKRVELPLITSGASGTLFDTAADSGDLTWWVSGNTHPNVAGNFAMTLGADTPQYSILTAV